MPNSQNNFTDKEALENYFQNKNKGSLLVTYRNCEGYEGMALCIMIVFDTQQIKYSLDLQWMSLGLDLYGDTLQESYVYEFKSLEEILAYLNAKYNIAVTDIPVHYQFDNSQFPNPIKDEEKKPIFEAAWERFEADFKKGVFIDPTLKMVYNTLDE